VTTEWENSTAYNSNLDYTPSTTVHKRKSSFYKVLKSPKNSQILTFDEKAKNNYSVPSSSPKHIPRSTLLSPMGNQRVRKQLKPVVISQILHEVPKDFKNIYKEFLESSKNNPLRYFDVEDNSVTENINFNSDT